MKESKAHHYPTFGTGKPPDPEPAPAPAPTPEPTPVEKEKWIKLRAKSYLNVNGVIHNTGEVFELPEQNALSLVGTGVAEQLPAED